MASQEWRDANREKIREYARAWRARNRERNGARIRQWGRENPESRMLTYAKSRAKKLGLQFNLTLDDIVIPEKCPCLGTTLNTKRGCGPGPDSQSLDRLDPKKGYVRGNVWVISQRANVIKNDASPDELISVAEALHAKLILGDLW